MEEETHRTSPIRNLKEIAVFDSIFLIIIGIPIGFFLLVVAIGAIRDMLPKQKSVLLKRNEQLEAELIEIKKVLEQKDQELSSKLNDLDYHRRKSLEKKERENQQELEQYKKLCEERIREYAHATDKEVKALNLTISSLQSKIRSLTSANTELVSKNEATKKEMLSLQAELRRQQTLAENSEIQKNLTYWNETSGQLMLAASKSLPLAFIGKPLVSKYIASMKTMRLSRALHEEIRIERPFELRAIVHSSSGEIYKTSLTDCSCKDFDAKRKGIPCKHMIALALQVRAFSPYGVDIQRAIRELGDTVEEISEKAEAAKVDRKKAGQYKTDCIAIQKIINEKKIYYPWLADLVAQYEMARYQTRQKKSSAQRKAEQEIKRLVKQNARLTNQLLVYEKAFPILADAKDLSPEEFVRQLSQQK